MIMKSLCRVVHTNDTSVAQYSTSCANKKVTDLVLPGMDTFTNFGFLLLAAIWTTEGKNFSETEFEGELKI